MSKKSRILRVALGLLSIAGMAIGQNTDGALKKGFEDPPSAARPLVWWHWMNGNITQEGIRLDLEWMHRTASPASRTSTPHSQPRRWWRSALRT